MSKLDSIQKVLIIGSDPTAIGQAVEFDYAGMQAYHTPREEGVKVISTSSNPATIMTDGKIVDKMYIEFLTIDTLKKVILKERSDSVLPTLSSQNALNLTVELGGSGFLVEHSVHMISTNADTIRVMEDRELFRETIAHIQRPCAKSETAETVEDSLLVAKRIGYPAVVRPAYTLGGSDGGIAYTEERLHAIVSMGLHRSCVSQVLVERCISGWKETGYEVIRDGNGNCITVCNMEDFDPIDIHTDDPIVVAPCQTLADKGIQMLRSASIAIINELKVEGGCSV